MLVVSAFSFPALIQSRRCTGIGSLLAAIPFSAAQVAKAVLPEAASFVQRGVEVEACFYSYWMQPVTEQLRCFAFSVVLWGTIIAAVAIRSQCGITLSTLKWLPRLRLSTTYLISA